MQQQLSKQQLHQNRQQASKDAEREKQRERERIERERIEKEREREREIENERRRQADKKRFAEEEEEKRRQAEKKRQADEEDRRRQAEKKRQAEEEKRRQAEKKRQAEEEEKKRQDEEKKRLEEEKKRQEEEKKRQEEERQRLAREAQEREEQERRLREEREKAQQLTRDKHAADWKAWGELAALRAQNLALQSRSEPARAAAELPSGLDSTIKKIQAYLRKLRLLGDQAADALVTEGLKLNLSKYTSEVVSALAEAKITRPDDVAKLIRVLSSLEARYPGLSALLVAELVKTFKPDAAEQQAVAASAADKGTAAGTPVGAPDKGAAVAAGAGKKEEDERAAAVSRKRTVLRVLTELHCAGLLTNLKIIGSIMAEMVDKEKVSLSFFGWLVGLLAYFLFPLPFFHFILHSFLYSLVASPFSLCCFCWLVASVSPLLKETSPYLPFSILSNPSHHN